MHQHPDRMPPLKLEDMDAVQKTAAEALIAGPRKAVDDMADLIGNITRLMFRSRGLNLTPRRVR